VIVGVADTHAALWYLHKNSRLSATARRFMDDAADAGHDIARSAISLAEIVYLVEKNRLPVSAYVDLKGALADPDYVIEEAPSLAKLSRPYARFHAPRFQTCRTASLPLRQYILSFRSSAATGRFAPQACKRSRS
jgi:predicted nucleic acid-binding protein